MKKSVFIGFTILIMFIALFSSSCGKGEVKEITTSTTEEAIEETAEEKPAETSAESEQLIPQTKEKIMSDYECEDLETLKTTLEKEKKILLAESSKLMSLSDPMAQRRQKFKVEKLTRSITAMENQVALLTGEC